MEQKTLQAEPPASSRPLSWFADQLHRLRQDRSGISVVEFALSLPIVIMLGMYGMEIAYMATTNMQTSQLALAVADNASRIGQTDNSAVTPSVTEQGIGAVLDGGLEQGATLDFEEHGRIILSSLEKTTATNRQYIHWQRCVGDKTSITSAYGPQGKGKTGATLAGLGKTGHVVTANTGSAVMFVEVYYDYQPLFGNTFVKPTQFRHEAAFIIRDDRNLLEADADGVAGTTPQNTC